MSAFEFNYTPTRYRKERTRNEDREPTIVNLVPFSAKSIVSFEDVPVTKTARRLLIVINPFDEVLKVSVTKQPKPELNVILEWSINNLAPQSQKNLELVWSPLKVVSCRETIQITDENGNKKDVSIILKSCELKKMSSRKLGPKKLKLKSPSPPKSFIRSVSASTPTKGLTLTDLKKNIPSQPLRKFSNILQPDLVDRTNLAYYRNSTIDKENNAPHTPKSASTLFDNIRFTPLTETKPKCESKLEYLSSLPTPVGVRRDDIILTDMTRRNLMEVSISPETGDEKAPHTHNHQTESVVPTIQFQFVKDTFDGNTFVTDVVTNEIEIVQESQYSILGNTRVMSPLGKTLGIISEEDQLITETKFHKTFEVNKSHLNVSIEEEAPIRVVSDSMREIYPKHQDDDVLINLRANQGSMPNLNEMDDSVGSIEHNRYFQQKQAEVYRQNLSIESVVSNADFRETEICAQSSCYNLNELASPQSDRQAILSVTPVKNSDDSPSLLFRSPTILRLVKEPEFKSPHQKKAQKMVFSPPARNKITTDIKEIQGRDIFDSSPGGRRIRATTWKHQQNREVFAIPKVPRDLQFQTRGIFATQSLNSLSCSSIASVGSTCSTPAVITKGKLYNENLINAYNQKHPFSATTTYDPFLSSTMYLDEQTLDNIEKTYMKWLNALVTIPADLEADKNEKIDVGKLFNDVQSKELALAPTKEAVCSRYYTNRLDSLRSLAVQFFHSEAVAVPLNKLTVVINEKNKLDVKTDRHIHLDLVLQRNLLELLLCYNPLWLRIGLEVTFNVQLNLQSNRDIFGMSRFIITNMFKSQYLAEKYSKFSQQKEYLEKLRKSTVKNFLFILFFLDRAKEGRLIKQNPCLFVKRAPFKESNEILKKFASLVLANYGDILKMLRRYDYTLTHKQTVIDEFDFAFKNLAVDLRDGVRLTKVMEVILLRDDLVQKVRVPAISRLQKVYNVDLALKALEAADYQILGNITSKDIADGHREKTLSLLWQIIYKFRAPRFNTAATTIQKFWRSKYLIIVIKRRIKEKEQEKQRQAATVIQKFFRGWKSRQAMKSYRERITRSCVAIQKFVRGFIIRRRYQRLIKSIVCVQRWYRQVVIIKKVRSEYQMHRKCTIVIQGWWKRQMLAKKLIASGIVIEKIKHEAFARYKSATVLQRVFKSFMIHKKLHKVVGAIVLQDKKQHQDNMAAAKIQSFVRMRMVRIQFLEIKTSIISIQRWWRHKREGKKQFEQFAITRQSIIKLQQWFRAVQLMKRDRINFLAYRQCVTNIQSRYRALLLMRIQRTEYQRTKIAAIVLQQQFRALQNMKIQRDKYQKLRQSTITIQRHFRATLQMRIQRQKFLKVISSAIVIQQKYRALVLMRCERRNFLEEKSAAVIIQHRYRALLVMRIQHRRYRELKYAVLKMQRRFRANLQMKIHRQQFLKVLESANVIQQMLRATLLMRRERQQFLRLKSAAVVIQLTFKSFLIHKKFHEIVSTAVSYQRKQHQDNMAAAKIQSLVRMRKVRIQFLEIKTSIISIQRWWRHKREGKKQFEQFAITRQSIIKLQQWFRGILFMKRQRNEFIVYRQCVIIIQSRYRALLVMRIQRTEYQRTKIAAIVLQQQFRALQNMKIQRDKYQKLRHSTITIQRRLQATLLMRTHRKEYLEVMKSVTVIQRKYRATILMKSERQEFLKIKSAAVFVQQRYRAQLLMRTNRTHYKQLQNAVIHVQRRFRACLECKKERIHFTLLKRLTITIQQNFRATKLMKQVRDEFQCNKLAAVKIQNYFRSYLKMKEHRQAFILLRSSAIFVQQRFRANVKCHNQREPFLKMKRATIKIQVFWRGYKKMKKIQGDFLKLKSAVVVIQQRFRSSLKTKKVRAEFIAKREAVVKIQRIRKAILEMRNCKTSYQQTIRAVISIQRRFRANQLMKIERQKFTTQKFAAIKIQQWYRLYQSMILERKRFLLLKKTVLLVEKRIHANQMMQSDRNNFEELRRTTIYVQKRFRSKQETRKVHQQFKDTREMVIKLQSRVRGLQSRQRYQEMQTPERLELRNKHKAARFIQAAWRGYRERSKKCNRCFKGIVERLMKAKRNVDPAQTLAEKLKMSITFLKESYDSNIAISFLAKLEYMSRTVPWILLDDAEFVSSFCYGLMAQAIRSEVDKQIIELCSCIILNLSRYKDTKESAFQEFGLLTIAQMLLRWCDKDCGIFNTLCTLVWVLAHCEKKQKIIRDFIMMKDGEFIVSQIKQNVLRKENMRKNSRRPIGFQSISLIKYKKDYQLQLRHHQSQATVYSSGFITPSMLQQCREIPSLQPDYGVVKTMPYIFYSSVFAFDNVLKVLGIENL